MTEATHEGAEVAGRNPKRDAAMDALVNRRNEEELIVEEEHEEPSPPPVRWSEELNAYVAKIKVDGEEQEVPFDEVVSSAQKVKASGKRFEEAAAMKQYAEELRAEAERIRQERRDTPPPQEDEVDDDSLKEIIKQYHKALYDDDEEKAIELLQQIRGRGTATQTVDAETTRRLIQQEIRQQQEQERNERFQRDVTIAQRRFEEEFPDIANDEVLRGIADQKTVEIMNSEPDLTPWEIISRASEQTREWMGSRSGTRHERKRSAEAQPSSSSVTSTSDREDDKPLTRSDIINELKQARHQKV